jgi:hypothetical protein
MTDSEEQAKPTAALPVSDLTRRLLRRATAPVGVIDTRHATELHARSRHWPRLELLENLKSRYGFDQQAGGAAGAAMPVAGGGAITPPFQRMATTPFDLTSTPPSAARAGMTETAMNTAPNASPAPSAPQYRVKRPNRHAEPNPSKPLSPETVTTQSSVASEIWTSTNPTATTQLRRKTRETQSADGGRPEASALPLVRAADPQRVDAEAAPRHVVTGTAMSRASTRDDLPGGEAPTSSGPSSAELQPAGGVRTSIDSIAATRRVDDESGQDGPLAAGHLPQVSELPRSTVPAPMTLQRMADGSAAATIGRAWTPGGLPAGDASTSMNPSSAGLSSASNELPASADSTAATRRADHEPAPGHDGPLAVGALPQVSELPRSTVDTPMTLQRMPDGSAGTHIGRALTPDDLPSGDAFASNSPSSTGLQPAAREFRAITDFIAAQRRVDDEAVLSQDGSLAAGALPKVSELPRSTNPMPMPLQRMPDSSAGAEIGRASTQDDLSGGDTSALSRASPTEFPPAANEIRVSTEFTTAVQRVDHEPRHDHSLAAGALPQVSELPRSAVAAPMTLQRMADGSAGAEIGRASTPDDFSSGDASTSRSPLTAAPLPQRDAGDPPTFPAAGPGATAEAVATAPHVNTPAQFRGAVSREIRTAPLQPAATSIVWRKADTRGNAATDRAPATTQNYSNGAQIMRATASEEVSSPIEAAIPMPASEGNGVDVFLIADQVSRIITRQLRIERERRGLRR